jgi:hypothetical protein
VHEVKVHYDVGANQKGPKQPGNDIDVYLRPLVDELFVANMASYAIKFEFDFGD